MRERLQTSRRNIRFRQWSRKAYAAFASIGACVTIGQLPKNVTERSLCKQQLPDASGCMERIAKENPKQEANTSPVPVGLQELCMQLLPQHDTEVYCTASLPCLLPHHREEEKTFAPTSIFKKHVGANGCLYTLSYIHHY